MKKISIIIIVIWVTFITLFAAKKEVIKITYVKSPLNVPSIVEKEKEIFKKRSEKYGIDIEYSNLTTGPEQTQALASGDIKFLNAVGATSVLLSAGNGGDIKIISIYSRSPKAFMLFSKDKDEINRVSLKGKKIAGPKGTILHELLISYLKNYGLTENDIEFIAMGIPESQAALVNGSVDFALLAGPAASNMIKDGYNVVTDGTGLVDATIVVATSKKYYDENKDKVEEFLLGQKEVLEYIDNNYDEVIKITAKETGLDVDIVKEMIKVYDFDMTIRDSDIQSVEKTLNFLYDNKMLENKIDVRDLFVK
ncbi:ABC transporter substrate-binding protein [Fusobacterium sp. PH5-44]|uniref:ABC transporter substrate-binding protein n=1 Tax=unclassified Fusobacterium TaxID=2648384 RepID=UPI003D1AF588